VTGPKGQGRVLFGFALVGLAAMAAVALEEAARVPAARRAVEPVAPVLPAEAVAALQEGHYKDALAALERRAAEPKATADDRAYLALVRGVALRLDGRPDDARAALRAALAATPKGSWAAKLRAELAAVELAARRPAEAEELARVEAETLLAGGRKDRLAEIYRGFAGRLLRPADPVTPPDPEGAYALLVQARSLAQGEATRARLLLEQARASRQGKNHPRAIQDFQAYLKEYPGGADRRAARLELGDSLLAAGQAPQARLTWSDLARESEGEDEKDAVRIRVDALYRIPATYGIPNPPDDAQLGLGVAALQRALRADPASPHAVAAAFHVGAAYQARGKAPEALAAFTDFIKGEDFKAEADDARREAADLTMAASFRVAQILQGQARYDEAVAAYRGYLAKFPDGPQSADAQRAILDAQWQAAADLFNRKQYEPARAAWRAFAAANPLDARVPQALFLVGEAFAAEEKFADAGAAWETLAAKFPGTEPAAHARFRVAEVAEERTGDPAAAIEEFKKVNVPPWQAQAQQRIAVMETRALAVVTPRAFRPGETPHLKVSTRNIEKLTFTAYKLNAEAYFRKKHALGGVEALDIGLVAPDAEWTAEVKGYGKFKPIATTYDLDKKVTVPGVWVVKVSDETLLQATTLVLGSDLDAIVKVSRDQLLVFAQDMKAGTGRAGARVLVADGSGVVLEAKTGADGVLLKSWDKPRDPNSPLDYLVLDGGDAAGTGLGIPGRVAQGLTARAYLYTDRPAYRPGQEVELRGVVREVKDGQYAHEPKAAYRLEVTDSRGRKLVARSATLSEFGTFHDRLPLDPAAPPGTYKIRLFRPGGSEFAGQFEVRAYQVRKVELKVDLPRTVYYRGEPIRADVLATDSTGIPLAGRPVVVQLPDGRTLAGETDKAGKFAVELPTEGFAEEQALRIVAQLPQDGVAAAATAMLAVRAFRIDLNTGRDVYLDGESFELHAATLDAAGAPTGQELNVSVRKRVERAGQVVEREVSKATLTTDAKTGKGTLALKVDDADGGAYVVRVAGTDRFKNPVWAEDVLTISGKKDETRLRILADRQSFKVGDEAKVNLHSRGAGGTALVAWEADRILAYKLLPLKEGDNPLTWEVDAAQAPNFTLTAARMAGTRFDEARLDVQAERDLRVEITPAKASVAPGEPVEVEVRTTDQRGRPVAAEVSLALVDRALLRLHRDDLPPIGAFFHDRHRTGAFATTATIPFRYAPATVPVSGAVVEEAQRAAALAANAVRLGEVRSEAARQVGQDMPAPPAAPAEAAKAESYYGVVAGRMGGVGGGMGQKAEKEVLAKSALARKSKRGVRDAKDARLDAGPALDDDDFDAVEVEKAGDEVVINQAFTFSLREGSLRRGPVARRRQVVETAYWNPAVATDAQGKARVTLRAPSALSRYQFTARGITAADTLAGQANAEIEVRKDFSVELKAPASLTQGDRPRFVARVRHRGGAGAGTARVRLAIHAGGREVVQPKELEWKEDGVDEVTFDPFEVPDAEEVRLVATAEAGAAKDEVSLETPVRPWGVPVFASASGTSSDATTAFLALPAGRQYERPEMVVEVAPTVRRLLVELALGRDVHPQRFLQLCRPVPPDTTADRASDLLAASAVLLYLRDSGAADEGDRLAGKIQGLVAELVAAQNEDGGWAWIAGRPEQPNPSDRQTTARVLWALRGPWRLGGMMTEQQTVEKAAAFLLQEFSKTDAADREARAAMLHALAAWGKATFEQANALNRDRQALPDAALAYLALTFAHLDRAALADEVLGVLAPRAKPEAAGPGRADRLAWTNGRGTPWHGPAETTALAALAFAEARPAAPERAGAVAWLEAHRDAAGWSPAKARGPALAALALAQGKAKAAEDRYRLVITVNDTKLEPIEVAGAAEARSIRVPGAALKPGGENRVRFEIEGRGTFGYAVTLAGFARDFAPEQDRADRKFLVTQRIYLAPEPSLDGKPLPGGFGVAVGATYFENWVKQIPLGGRARVRVDLLSTDPGNKPLWERDFLVLRESLPAGTTLVEGSVQTQASHYELADGVLTFYFAPGQLPRYTYYDVHGYLPGAYRSLPARLSSAFDPARQHLGEPGALTVLMPGEKSSDPYRPTPDELYARGKGHFDAGRLAAAAGPLEDLFGGYTLRDDVLKDTARMLLEAAIAGKADPHKVVKYFEVLKEKAPELVLPFDRIAAVGRAYRAIGESERAYLVWRAVAEASYLEDARIGQALNQRGKTLEGTAFLLDLWREYPDTASIRADLFGLSRVVADLAARAVADGNLRREMTAAGVTRPDLQLQAIRLTQAFLALEPKGPQADEASLALVGDFLELEDFAAVVKLARRFAALYPRSSYLDSFQYSEALGRFHLGEYDRAVAVAEAIAKTTYKDANGADQPSPNKWQALYILGQIYDARRQPGKALEYYQQVADRFTDAAGAVKGLKRVELKLPEVAVVRPDRPAAVASGVGLRAVPIEGPSARPARPGVTLDYRNVAEADVTVYPVDLMRLYLTRRTLDGIAGVDLAGISPLFESKVKLGDGADYDDRTRSIDLPLAKEGAYLVMVRGGDRYASGVVLVSPLELEVLEEADAGRVRVTVRDARTKEPAAKVQVKVIGTDTGAFLSGQTDLRGVFVAEGVRGKVTAVARRGTSEYAFHRGTAYVGAQGQQGQPKDGQGQAANAPAGAERKPQGLGLEDNIRLQNSVNCQQQINRLNSRYNPNTNANPNAPPAPQGVQVKDAY